jgi:hypothetical protein
MKTNRSHMETKLVLTSEHSRRTAVSAYPVDRGSPKSEKTEKEKIESEIDAVKLERIELERAVSALKKAMSACEKTDADRHAQLKVQKDSATDRIRVLETRRLQIKKRLRELTFEEPSLSVMDLLWQITKEQAAIREQNTEILRLLKNR